MLHNQIPHPISFHPRPKLAAIAQDKVPHRMLVVRRRRQPQYPPRQIQKFRSFHIRCILYPHGPRKATAKRKGNTDKTVGILYGFPRLLVLRQASPHPMPGRWHTPIIDAPSPGGLREWKLTGWNHVYGDGLAFQMASVSAEPWLRTSLSVRISSVAAIISLRGNTSVSPARLSNSMTMNSSLESRRTSTR